MNMHIFRHLTDEYTYFRPLSNTSSEQWGLLPRNREPGVRLIGKLIELLPPMEVEELDKISLTLVYRQHVQDSPLYVPLSFQLVLDFT